MWRKIEQALADELEREGWEIRSASNGKFACHPSEDLDINLERLAKAVESDLK